MQPFFNTDRFIHFEDCDPAGIVYFVNYLHFAQAVLGDYFKTQNLFNDFYGNTELVFPVIATDSKFTKMVKMGDLLNIELSASQIRESSIEFQFIFTLNGSPAAEVRIAHVCINKQTLVKKKLPDFLSRLKE